LVVIEVDQSGKWEGNCNTVIGVATPGQSFSFLVSNKEKKHIQQTLGGFDQERTRSKKAQKIRWFTYTVYLSVRFIMRPEDTLVIDEEYEGQEQGIRDLLIHLLNKHGKLQIRPQQVQFGRVGKQSMAHVVANQTFSQTRLADYTLSANNYFTLLDKTAEKREKAFKNRVKNRAK
jgi:hypothetical protein